MEQSTIDPWGDQHHWLPSWVSLGQQVFEVSWEYRAPIEKRHAEESAGWFAKCDREGHQFRGFGDSPLSALVDLADQLNRNLRLGVDRFATELPVSRVHIREVLKKAS